MKRRTILVVEDNRDELMIYTTLLNFRGYEILAAGDFDAAVEIAREKQPDLAVIDVNLNDPDRDGCDLVALLREDARTQHIPIIAHTAFGDVYRQSLERVGCQTIIHKPSSPSVLLEAIDELLGPADDA
jgi:CheY-like chemotaxis protein